MNKTANIKKEEIIQVFELFLEKIKKEDFNFKLLENNDYYWDIVLKDELYNPYEEPKSGLSLGSLTDDWEHLKSILEEGEKQDTEVIWYDFRKLAMIIRMLELVHIQ